MTTDEPDSVPIQIVDCYNVGVGLIFPFIPDTVPFLHWLTNYFQCSYIYNHVTITPEMAMCNKCRYFQFLVFIKFNIKLCLEKVMSGIPSISVLPSNKIILWILHNSDNSVLPLILLDLSRIGINVCMPIFGVFLYGDIRFVNSEQDWLQLVQVEIETSYLQHLWVGVNYWNQHLRSRS